MRPTRSMLLPWLLLTSMACAHASSGDEPEPQSNGEPVQVDVRNNYALPVEIYALGSGITQRLGTVHPGMTGHFVLPQGLIGAGGVELQARPGSDEQPFRSDRLLLSPGAIVDFVIAPVLFNSTAALRP